MFALPKIGEGRLQRLRAPKKSADIAITARLDLFDVSPVFAKLAWRKNAKFASRLRVAAAYLNAAFALMDSGVQIGQSSQVRLAFP